MKLQPDTPIRVSADISRGSMDMTYAQLLDRVGQDPCRSAMIAALESGKPYDLDGILIERAVPFDPTIDTKDWWNWPR